MNPLRYFDLILLVAYIWLTLCVNGSKFGECGNILSEIDLDAGVHQIDLYLSTGRSCRCSDSTNSYWTVWSPCSPRGSCFETKQHRTKRCLNGCYRIQTRRCRKKPYGCTGKWGSWSNDYSCFSTTTSVTRTRFCYSKSGKLGSYCNASRDEFYQRQRVPCIQYASESAPIPTSGNSNNSRWTTSGQGNLVIIVLSVLAGIFLVALIFISIMFVTLRKSTLVTGGSKGRSGTESTASATSYLTTLTDKELSSTGGSQKYYQINTTRFLTSSNANDSPPARTKETVLFKREETQDTLQSCANETDTASKRQQHEEKIEIVNKEQNVTDRTSAADDSSKQRGIGLFKKAHNRRSDKTSLKDAMVIASVPAFDDVPLRQKPKKEYFQSLPHIRTEEVAFRRRTSKDIRFSGGKEISKNDSDRKSRDRRKSEDEIVFSGWDKSNASTPTKSSSHNMQHEFNNSSDDIPKKMQRPMSNTFLFSSKAFNSLQKTSTGSRGMRKTNGFKLDYNILMKKAVAANARGRGGIDDEQPNITFLSHDDSGNYSHIDPEFRRYGSALDAKPIDADAISNGSAYADVWDAEYTSKPSDNDEDDYSEVFDARSKAKLSASAKVLSRPTDLSNRSLPSIRARSNTVHETPSRLSRQPPVSGAMRSPTKDRALPPIAVEDQESSLKETFTDAANEPIYCAI